MGRMPEGCNRALRGVALGGALALGTALGGCLGYDGDFDRGYQVDPETVSQIKVGATTKEQALSTLGTPSTTSTVGGDAWYYIGQKMHRALAFMPVQMTDQHVLAIYFDKGGKVSRVANYGMQDGKVFDYVSRTTPTGGQEPDFLRNIMGGLFKFS
ncbi:MAG TPA: outer membrane protein assembly factor BamE [Roseiarcus sp.]|nr:outer membrane protein assembly factor BamE [Roseiarcus sp.]